MLTFGRKIRLNAGSLRPAMIGYIALYTRGNTRISALLNTSKMLFSDLRLQMKRTTLNGLRCS